MGLAKTFKALSDPVRRETLVLLKEGRLSAGEIAEHFNLSGATISYHLSQLKEADLVFEQKHKNFIYYYLNISLFEELLVWIKQFERGEEDVE